MNKIICITGGGTGGHLSVARSIIDEYHSRGYKIIYIGSQKGADKDWFETYKNIEQSFFLKSHGVVNQKFVGKIFSVINIIKQSFFCMIIFKKYSI